MTAHTPDSPEVRAALALPTKEAAAHADAEARAEFMRRLQSGCPIDIVVSVPTPLTASGLAAMRESFEAALAELASTLGVHP